MINICRYLQSLFLMKYKNNKADYSIAASQSDSEKLIVWVRFWYSYQLYSFLFPE